MTQQLVRKRTWDSTAATEENLGPNSGYIISGVGTTWAPGAGAPLYILGLARRKLASVTAMARSV